jgi:NAD(P)-dependent dehydrogenase (short-subunit alcohol dehydrogenase family)
MKVLGKEMASFGVRVLTVQLGAFDTEFTSGGMLVKMDEEAEAAYSGSVAAKVMKSLSGGNFQPDGDHVKASNVIYEVIVGEGVGKGRETERILPLGRDMGTRIQDTIAGWQHTMDVFGEVCNGVSKF